MTRSSRLAATASAVIIGAGVLASTTPASASEPNGTAFGNPCAAVTIIAIPGTHETTDNAGMDVAQAMLSNVTSYISENGDSSIRTHYLGYPASLLDYDNSRAHGYQAAWSTVNYYAEQCPTTSFILLGYSQGAHIAGDLAATIGKQGSPVSADRVRSVRLLADPVRDPSAPVVGSGGAAGGVLGERGDFGALDDRVTEYCDSEDVICNASISSDATALTTWFGPHTSYQSETVPGTNETYTQQMTDDMVQDIINLNDATY